MPYIGKQPLTGAYQLCDTITTSATATYNLLVGGSAVIPGSANNCIVSLNGVVQAPVGAFTVSGSQITFASALTSSDVIDFILILGNVFDIGTPTNGAVTNSSLNSNVITGQTAETSVASGDLVLIYDDSAAALRKMTRTNFVGGTQEFAAGTAASPSITFTGDTNTGIFSPTADTIAFTKGGSEAMRIASNGDVTISSTNPLLMNNSSTKLFGGGQKTVSTITTIITADQPGSGNSGNLTLVNGVKQGNGTIMFTDVVLFGFSGSSTVISSTTTNSPAGRTYSVSTGDLRLAMAADTYIVQATALRQGYQG